MRRLLAVLLGIASLLLGSCASAPRTGGDGPLILVSIDAFRWDFLQNPEARTLRQLAQDGVHARRMTPSFPSKTFPNHYTLATGLRPEHHGIVSNTFFDPDLNASFNKNRAADNADARWWTGGEPIWITAEKQGVRSACCLWPGDEVELAGHRPTFLRKFEKSLTSAQRVEILLGWLALPAAERPRVCALYLENVDNTGHLVGPDAPEMNQAIKEADAAVAQLLAGLARLGLRDTANLVIVSDHGLSPTSPDRVIFFDDLMDVGAVQIESNGANGGVRPKTGTPAALAAAIRAKAPPQLKVYLREEMPERLHYRASNRISPVVLVADDTWMIESRPGAGRAASSYEHGNHGWDPALPNMGALFIANGPAYRRGATLDDVRNIDVYNLLCATLGLAPAANDGDGQLARAVLAR